MCHSHVYVGQRAVCIIDSSMSFTSSGEAGSALHDIEVRLPHMRQLLVRLAQHGGCKEIDILCGGLAHLADILPIQSRSMLSRWAIECCSLEDSKVRHWNCGT